MRRKLTEPDDEPSDELPELTAQQMEFVRHILAGDNNSTAYRKAYDCSNSQPESIWCNASKLRSDARVMQWLSAAQKACMGASKVTLEGHLQQLERLREIALATGNVGAAVAAEQNRGKAAGHYVERYEDMTKDDPAETLEQLARQNPDLARMLATQSKISLETKH